MLPTFKPGAWPTDGNCYFSAGLSFAGANPQTKRVLDHEAFGALVRAVYSSVDAFRAGPPEADTYFDDSRALLRSGI